MKTNYVEITPIVGQTGTGSPKLFKRKVLLVERSGISYDIKRGVIPSPGAREVDYIGAFGIVRFDQPFNAGEIIKVWYKL